jgi:hypothetical protein
VLTAEYLFRNMSSTVSMEVITEYVIAERGALALGEIAS